MFGLWRTCQHYCEQDSIPDIVSVSRTKVIDNRGRVPAFGRKAKFLAQGTDGGKWTSVGFLNPDGTLRAPRRDQDIYDRVRRGQAKWSGDVKSYPPSLTTADHPIRTIDLDTAE